MFINTNVSAMNSQRHLFNTNTSLDKTLERLSSGLRINTGADDASGLAISEKMAAQNAGLTVAHQNAQDGQALYKIADGALAQVGTMLSRMEELAVRATNGTLTSSDRQAITNEIVELSDQINKISSTTEYNTLKLMNGSIEVDASLTFATANTDSLRIIDKPGQLQNTQGTRFSLTALATAATITGTGAGVSATTAGMISINGVDISIAAGDTASAMAAKINAMNNSTGVIAAMDSASVMTLITGTIDSDAGNVDTTMSNVIGYARQGSTATITVNGNQGILTAMGGAAFAAGTAVSGANATGKIGGVAMANVNGTALKDVQNGSATYGMVIDSDLYNGANGVMIRNNVAATSIITHRSSTADTASAVIDISQRLRLQIGANYDQSIYNGIANVNTTQLGIGGSSKYGNLESMKLDTADNANISLKVVQKAIQDVTGQRSKLGATMNRLDYTIRTLSIQRENMTAAQSRIQDADISQEMTTFTKQQIMLQAGTAMLSQANARPQAVLQLLK